MNLRELVNIAYAVICSTFSDGDEMENFRRELYAAPGERFKPKSKGTDQLMALMGAARAPQPRIPQGT